MVAPYLHKERDTGGSLGRRVYDGAYAHVAEVVAIVILYRPASVCQSALVRFPTATWVDLLVLSPVVAH